MAVAQTRLEVLQICKLLQCVRENDEEQIKKLTESGVPNLINYNEPNDGETALSTAAVRNMDTMIAFLLKLGKCFNEKLCIKLDTSVCCFPFY